MLKLLKYEFLRRKKLLLSLLLVMVFLEAVVYLSANLGENWNFTAIILFAVLLVGGFLFPLIDAVTNYYSDFKRNKGYMLFLTPNKGIKIFGAKALFVLAEIVAIVLLMAFFIKLNVDLLTKIYPELMNEIIFQIELIIKLIFNSENATFWTWCPLVGLTVLQYFANTMIALLSITIAKTVLSKKSFNWLFALLFYFGVSVAMQTINSYVLVIFGLVGDMTKVTQENSYTVMNIIKYLSVGTGMYIAWAFSSIFISSKLLDKRIDL